MSASELEFLAHMDLEAGRRGEAIEKYRLAVEAAPEDAALRERARALEPASR